jgi:SAM-dependent methyltransferase
MQQDRLFLEGEGDQWFDRNAIAIDDKATQFDWPTYLIETIEDKSGIKKIAELGCSNGWRLQQLQDKFPQIEFSGIDPSKAAIEDGQKKYPKINLQRGVLADIPLKEEFDVVVIFFVLCWVDRYSLAKSIAEIDRLVKDGGLLIIGDFYPDFPYRRKYHHLPEDNVFTYKQNYNAIFESLGTYKEVTKVTSDNDKKQGLNIQICKSFNRLSCSVLHKSLASYYYEL